MLVGLCESFLPILQMEAWLPHSGSELLSSLVFFPLLLSLASRSGLADVGYLRVGQILQQLFALLPGTLVPVLFLRLRQAESFEARMRQVEPAAAGAAGLRPGRWAPDPVVFWGQLPACQAIPAFGGSAFAVA
jgi:hypothetical protein